MNLRTSLIRCGLLVLLASALPAQAAGLQPWQIVSGDLPPFAIEHTPKRPGLLVELVEAMSARAGQTSKVQFFPWARALAMASSQPRTAILPLTRTPEREANFQWLVRLYVQRFVFINNRPRPPINTLDSARQQRIVVLRGSPNYLQLMQNGFLPNQVVQASSTEEMQRFLERGLVDAIYGGDVINLEKVRSSGRQLADFQVGMVLASGDVWLAAGKGMEEAERSVLQAAYDSLQADGSLARLFARYGLTPP